MSHLQLFGCSPHRNRLTSQRIDPRTLLDQPTTPTGILSSTSSRVPWDRTATCTVVSTPRASRTGCHQLQACPLQVPLRCCSVCHDLVGFASTVRLLFPPLCLRHNESIIVPQQALFTALQHSGSSEFHVARHFLHTRRTCCPDTELTTVFMLTCCTRSLGACLRLLTRRRLWWYSIAPPSPVKLRGRTFRLCPCKNASSSGWWSRAWTITFIGV